MKLKKRDWRGVTTKVRIADLFCGAGGTSSGAVDAVKILGRKPELTAINHWDTAIATHTENHPDARHLLTAVDNVNPRSLYKEGELDLLWASPECTHHSVARGGRPINEQSRATAWCVVRWAGDLQPGIILVENVPEFITWGGIGANGRPLKNKKGQTYLAWKAALESLGYRVSEKILCAADYGDPTTRRRLFVMAVRGKRKIVWPEPTHACPQLIKGQSGSGQFHFERKRLPWVAAREIIDWKLEGQSIYDRKRPLSDKTMRRIMTGLQKFGLRPFIVPQHSGRKGANDRSAGRVDSIEKPLGAVTTTSRGVGVVEPFIIGAGGPEYSAKPKSVDEPLNTVIAEDRRALVQPFIGLAEFLIPNFGEREGQEPRCHSIDEPLPAVTSHGAGGLVTSKVTDVKLDPFVVGIDHHGGNGDQLRSTSEPLSTISTKARHAVAEPFLVQLAHGESKGEKSPENRRVKSIHEPLGTIHAGGNNFGIAKPELSRVKSVDEPMPTVCGNRGDVALVEPHLLPQHGGGALRPVSEPAPTVATAGAIGLVDACLVKFYGAATGAQSVDDPLDTVTSKERHGIATFSKNKPPLQLGQSVSIGTRWGVKIDGETYLLDIRFRMLQPHELAAAQGFKRDYKFTGNKSEQVKQIGNAVPRHLARALVLAAVTQDSDISKYLEQEAAA
jgi:DNA (cytosine-5)-methyltransferase 1